MSQSARLPAAHSRDANDAYADLHARAMKSMRLRAFQPQIASDLEESAAKRRAAIAAMTRYHSDWRDRITEKETKKAEERHKTEVASLSSGSTFSTKLTTKKPRRQSIAASQRDTMSGSQENVHLQTLLHMAQLEHSSHVERLAEQASFSVHAGGASTASVSAASALVPQTGRGAKTDADLESIAASILSTNTLMSMANRSDRISGALFARAFDASVSEGLLPPSLASRAPLTAGRMKGSGSSDSAAPAPTHTSTRNFARGGSPLAGRGRTDMSGIDTAPSHACATPDAKAAYYGSGAAFNENYHAGRAARSRGRAREVAAGLAAVAHEGTAGASPGTNNTRAGRLAAADWRGGGRLPKLKLWCRGTL
jgi:hypothetical protein